MIASAAVPIVPLQSSQIAAQCDHVHFVQFVVESAQPLSDILVHVAAFAFVATQSLRDLTLLAQ